MFKSKRHLLLILTLLFSTSLFAQSNFKNNYEWDDWSDYGFEFDYDRPFIELNYGFGQPKHDAFNVDLSKVGLIELKLGYLKESDISHYNIDDRKESFVFGSKISPDLSNNEVKPLEFESTLWRFGFASRNTLGYYGDDFSVLPYYQDGFVWSMLETSETKYPILDENEIVNLLSPEAANDYKIVERYRDTFRFGTVNEGGIRFEFVNSISINAGYEASVIFPRHLFWKQAGSYIIQKAGQGALNYFIDEIIDSSPIAGPIVSFLLQNGYAYAFYQLQKKDMNWPFSTEAPLTYETFKLGVTFTF